MEGDAFPSDEVTPLISSFLLFAFFFFAYS